MIALLVIIYIVFISLGLPDSMFGVSWPVVYPEMGVAENFAVVYSIITGVCTGGAGLVAGKLLRKFGTPKVTFVSILLTAIGLVGISFSPNIWLMMFFTIILGYGGGAIDTGLNSYVSLHYKARHMSWLHCFWGVGVTVSPLIFSTVLEVGGTWRLSYRIVALMQLSIAMLVLFNLRKWIRTGVKPVEKTAAIKEKLNLRNFPGLFISILSQGCYTAMEFLISIWGATFLVNVFHADAALASWWVSLFYGGLMLGRFVSGFVSIKLGDNTILRWSVLMALLGVLVLLIPVEGAAGVSFFLIGFGFGPIYPSIIHSVPSRFGATFAADITGFHIGGASGVGFGLQLLLGYLFTETTFYLFPVALILLSGLFFLLNEVAIRRTAKNTVS